MGVIRIPIEEAYRFGTVAVDRGNRVRGFVEKSPNPVSSLASMDIYVFNKEVLARRLAEDAAPPRSVHDFGYSIIPRMVEGDHVFAYQFSGYWQDIGTVEAYYAANMELLGERPRFSLDSTGQFLQRPLIRSFRRQVAKAK